MEIFLKSLSDLFSISVRLYSGACEIKADYSSGGGEPDYLGPEGLSGIKEALFREEPWESVLIYRNDMFLSWVALRTGGDFLLAGPVAPENFNYDYFSRSIEHMQISIRFDRKAVSRMGALKRMSESELESLGTMIHCAVSAEYMRDSDGKAVPVRHVKSDIDLSEILVHNSPAFGFWEFANSLEMLKGFYRIVECLQLENRDGLIEAERTYFNRLEELASSISGNRQDHWKIFEYSLISLHSILSYYLIGKGAAPEELLETVNRFALSFSSAAEDSDWISIAGTITESILDRAEENRHDVYDGRIQNVLENLMLNYNRNISLQEAADSVQMSAKNLSKLFRKEMGVGFKTYMDEKRLTRIKNLLKLSDYSLLDIALENGFSDQSHFSNWFKSKTEMTPAEFRKRG